VGGPEIKVRGTVIAVSRNASHHFSKQPCTEIRLLAGLGVEGDAHQGLTVKHRSRVAVDPTQPNLRQAHLIHSELYDELRVGGFEVGPGDLGENITTRGVDLLALPRGALLRIGVEATLFVTGLRNPCRQIEAFQSGLLAAVLDRGPHGELVRKAGIMSVVQAGGVVRPGDPITVELPPQPHLALEPV
jgi:hypothetical protein